MTTAILNANVFIPLMTPEYNASSNCKREYVIEGYVCNCTYMHRCEAAAIQQIPMVPIRLAKFQPEGWLFTAVPPGITPPLSMLMINRKVYSIFTNDLHENVKNW